MNENFKSTPSDVLSFVRLFDNVEDFVFLMRIEDDELQYCYINTAVRESTVLDGHFTGMPLKDVVHDSDEALELINHYTEVAWTKVSKKFVQTLKKENGVFVGDFTLYPLLDYEGDCEYILAIVRDITEKQLLEDQLYETKKLFQIITHNSLDVIRILDKEGTILYSSPSSEWVSGFKSDHYIGNHFIDFIDIQDRDFATNKFQQLLVDQNPARAELRHINKEGTSTWIEVVATPIVHHGEVTQIITSSRDVTDRREYRERLAHMAFYDYLSGLPNRRLLDDRLEMAIRQASRFQKKVGLLLLDGKNFKRINDRFGHETGDDVIVEVSRTLENNVRIIDTVGRLGGDEFVIVLPDIERIEDAILVANRVQEAFSTPLHINAKIIDFTIDIGIALFPDHARDRKALLRHADQALYATKLNDSVSISVYEPCTIREGRQPK